MQSRWGWQGRSDDHRQDLLETWHQHPEGVQLLEDELRRSTSGSRPALDGTLYFTFGIWGFVAADLLLAGYRSFDDSSLDTQLEQAVLLLRQRPSVREPIDEMFLRFAAQKVGAEWRTFFHERGDWEAIIREAQKERDR